MANISIGYGTATIYAKNLREIAELAYLQYLGWEESCYYTTLTEVDELGYILNSDENTLSDKLMAICEKLHINTSKISACSICAEFALDFAGRWTFSNNIDWFFSDAFNLDHQYKYKDEINQLIDRAKQRTYYVEFNFTEEEGGVGFIQEGSVVIKWDGKCQKQTIESEEYHEHEYSAENLIKFGIYDEGDVWDTEYIIKNPEIFYNELERGILDGYYKDLIHIAENLSLFITFLEVNREELDTGVYWDIQEWYEGNLEIDGLDVEWAKFLGADKEEGRAMIREELKIQNVKNLIKQNRQTFEENMLNLYQMDLIEQVKSIDDYPAMFSLPVAGEGFYDKEELYRHQDPYSRKREVFLPIARKLIQQLKENGWDIHEERIYYEDGELYFYLETE